MIIECTTGNNVEIPGKTLEGANLAGLDLHRAQLENARLRGANLDRATLRNDPGGAGVQVARAP